MNSYRITTRNDVDGTTRTVVVRAEDVRFAGGEAQALHAEASGGQGVPVVVATGRVREYDPRPGDSVRFTYKGEQREGVVQRWTPKGYKVRTDDGVLQVGYGRLELVALGRQGRALVANCTADAKAAPKREAKPRRRTRKPKHATREEWLNACAEALRPLFAEAGAEWDKVRVSVGFPKGGRSGSSHAIGQCWAHRCSADEHAEIFISPELDDPARVADVLAHELIHAAVGVEEGHKASTFGKVARAIGLEGKLTATVAGPELRKRLEKITKSLGAYPHRELRGGVGGRRGPGGPLGPSGLPKQGTRLLKVACPDCGCIVRMTAKWLNEVGAPTCGCGSPMAAACLSQPGEACLMAEVSHRQMGEYAHPNLVRLIQPRCMGRIEETAAAGMRWAADNDGFDVRGPELGAAVWTDEKVQRYVRMLDRLEGLPGCIFVTAPDVVGRADVTLELFHEWLPALRERGLPPALVAQDGAESMELPWDDFDALFIGGSTEWKEGPGAARLAREAKRRGKWVHWGRVNTRRRFELIVATGACDSFDGSKFARWAKTYLRVGLDWTTEPVQLDLAA